MSWLADRTLRDVAASPPPPAATRTAAGGEERTLLQRVQARMLDECADLDLAGEQDAAGRICREVFAHLPRTRRDALTGEVMALLGGRLGPLQTLLEDPDVTEVMVNAPDQVYVERAGALELTPVTFRDDASVQGLVERIVGRVGRRFDRSNPMVDARLPDGSRLNAIRPELALRGTAVTIRRFPRAYTWPQLLAGGTVPAGPLGDTLPQPRPRRPPAGQDAGAFLAWAVATARLNLMVSGGTGTGKTTLLNALSGLIPEGQRLIYIEDAAELQPQQRHVVRLEAKLPNAEGRGQVSVRALVRNALRMRPDRIIVGEVRMDEAIDMLQAMNTGHDGSMTTIHANGARDAITRLETMVLMGGMEMPLRAVRQQIAAALDLIVHLRRDLRRASGRVVEAVCAVDGLDGTTGDIRIVDIFRLASGMLCPASGARQRLERGWDA